MKLLLDIPEDIVDGIYEQFGQLSGKVIPERTFRVFLKETVLRCLDEEVVEIAVQETFDLQM